MRFRPAAALSGLLMFVALAVPAFTSSPAAAAACPDVEVVFARGTGEPPGIGSVGNAFVSSLRSQMPGKSVGTYGVSYPASYNFLAATTGANDASGHLQDMANKCPDTKLVLGGYSQGAAVVDIVTAAPVGGVGFTRPLPPDVADHVAAVAVFGNPSDHLGGVLSSLSPQYTAKTIDLCTGGDPVCSNGNTWSAHTGYVPTMTTQAARFVAARV
ncbi:cutinase [Mycobacterium noviomagense]|uniref:Cutinase n=2 Tax=Mycobacterium noviomagense TaxID=459858 RepID=A0A7I7PFM4_9MYCO|nr:cutinase [Mycobacterium noviomagense]